MFCDMLCFIGCVCFVILINCCLFVCACLCVLLAIACDCLRLLAVRAIGVQRAVQCLSWLVQLACLGHPPPASLGSPRKTPQAFGVSTAAPGGGEPAPPFGEPAPRMFRKGLARGGRGKDRETSNKR